MQKLATFRLEVKHTALAYTGLVTYILQIFIYVDFYKGGLIINGIFNLLPFSFFKISKNDLTILQIFNLI